MQLIAKSPDAYSEAELAKIGRIFVEMVREHGWSEEFAGHLHHSGTVSDESHRRATPIHNLVSTGLVWVTR